MSTAKPVEDLKPLELQCVIAIRDGLENGKIRTPHLLPLMLRQYVLDIVLMHGSINRSSCLSTLSSVEFLDGFTSLSTQRGNVDDTPFLERVTESMSEIGERIRELKLNVYGCIECKKRNRRKKTTMAVVLRLIAKCPNLESLSLQAVTCMGKLDKCNHDPIHRHIHVGEPEFLNDLASGTAILQNLKHLRLTGSGCRPVFLRNRGPMIKFSNLSSLALISCKIAASAWAEFLPQVQNTLTSLILKRVWIVDKDGIRIFEMRAVVPLTLPRLETMIVWEEEGYLIDQDFVDDLIDCSQLKRVELTIGYKSKVDEEVLSKLTSWLSERESQVGLRYFNIGRDYRSAIDSDSHFVLVKAFGSTISSFKLRSPAKWNQRLSIALADAVSTCQKLESIEIDIRGLNEHTGEIESALLQLFDNEDRALRLRHLVLAGEFSNGLLASIFKNCSKLEILIVEYCSQLDDSHLIKWASYGGQMTWFSLTGCRKVTEEGILPVLINSGDRLEIFWDWERDRPLDDRLWRGLFSHCRFLQIVIGCPEEFEGLMNAKCHNKMHKVDFGYPIYRYR